MARFDDLPDDPGELKKLLAERDAALAEKDALLAAKDALLAKREAAWQQLKAALVWFRQRMFGRSSEKISRGALEELLACCAAVFGEDDLTHEGACGASSEESGAGKSATEEVAPAGDVADGEAAKRGGEDGEEGEEEEFQLVEGYLRRRGGADGGTTPRASPGSSRSTSWPTRIASAPAAGTPWRRSRPRRSSS